MQILLLLQEDGRRSNAEIARLVGSSEPTVRKRIDRLMAEKIIKVVAVLNPVKTAYRVDVLIMFQTQPGMSLAVGAQLEADEHAVYVAHTTGEFDIIGEFLFRSEEELMHFLNDRTGEIEGVVRTQVACVLQTRKINYDWKLPSEFVESRLRKKRSTASQQRKKRGTK